MIIYTIAFVVALVAAIHWYCKSTILYNKKCQNEKQLNDLVEEKLKMQHRIDLQQRDVHERDIKIVELQATMQSMNDSILQHKEDIKSMERQFKESFENISSAVLANQTKQFNEQSNLALDSLLEPFRQEIQTVKEAADKTFCSTASLKGAMQQVVDSNETTKKFVSVLKGSSKAQGNWGEMILKNILDASGLRAGIDYIEQAENMGLINNDNKVVRPDFIVKLPENKHIIIDSKVALVDYERYSSSEDNETQAMNLKNYIGSVRNHIKSLHEKQYHDVDKLNTPDFVLMFLCIEAAYILAIQSDSEMHNYAWNKRIVIVGPSTLFATLRTISSVWRLELQKENVANIAKKGGALCDQLAAYIDDLKKIGTQLDTVKKTHEFATKKLYEGRGCLVNRAKELQELGVKCNKQIVVRYINTAAGEELDEDNDNSFVLEPIKISECITI